MHVIKIFTLGPSYWSQMEEYRQRIFHLEGLEAAVAAAGSSQDSSKKGPEAAGAKSGTSRSQPTALSVTTSTDE